jgi:nitronate monooxygenase
MQTAFTRAFGLDWPIVQAGMGGQAGADLASAVSDAGALGTVGTIATPPDVIRATIASVREVTTRPFSVNLAAFPEAPFGGELLELVQELRPPSVTLSFAVTPALVERMQAAGIPVIVQLQRAAQVREIVAAQPAAIVAQGGEAGGHTGSRGLFSFLCEVLDMAGDIPVLAAGGIADGRGLAGALAMGAAGAVMGTRFKATTEFAGPAFDKESIVSASGDGTLRDSIVDVPIPFPWPEDSTGRLLANEFTQEWHGRDGELLAMVQERGYGKVLGELGQDPARSLNWAGESSGLVREILPAAEVVRRTIEEARECLRRATASL